MIVEVIAIIMTLLSVFLANEKSVLTWSTGILGCMAYAIIFYREQLIANFVLQFIFIIQSFIGLLSWKGEFKFRRRNIPLMRLEVLILVMIFFSVFTLMKFTDDPYPFFDTLGATLSIAGMYYLARKEAFSWLIWMAADMVYIILFTITGMTLSYLLYTVLFVFAFRGWKQWTVK